MDIAYKIIVKGRVTGVGFRWYAADYIRQFNTLTGYVRNICHGEVEALIQGPENHVNLVREWFMHGPSHARVDEYSDNKIPCSHNFTGFNIR